MCRLKLIRKKNLVIEDDHQIKLGEKEFNLLDKPYYVVESSEEWCVVYTFHYMDKTEDQREITDEHFQLIYGIFTGRIYSFVVKSRKEDHVPAEAWESFRKEKLLKIFETNLAKSNLQLGFSVIKKLYWGDYTILE